MPLSNILIVDASDRFGWLAGRALADLGAEVVRVDPPGTDRSRPEWRAFNANKRVLDVDPAKPADQHQLEELLAKADICLLPAGELGVGGRFAPRKLRERYPRLIVVVITPFGCAGPRRDWRATDIEVMAAGGAMALAGEPDGLPLRVSEPQSYPWAGAQAATGALVALYRREATGRGDLVEVSAQSSVVAAIAHAPAFFDVLGVEPKRAGAFMTGRSIHGARYRVFWPCKDGWLNFIFYGGTAGRRTNEQLVGWMRERGAELGCGKYRRAPIPGAMARRRWNGHCRRRRLSTNSKLCPSSGEA
jgi:crotonobetainyl-CoA:carnitine CoA-transferase CaiB-like acyl-CoA transferase